MRRLISVVVLLAVIIPQPRVIADTENHQNNPGETLAWIAVIGAAYGLVYLSAYSVGYLIKNGEEFSEGRKGRYGLIEGGMASRYGTSYTAGALLGDNSLFLARHTQHLSPNRDVDFKTYEVSYRHYYEILFGELGLFKARHREIEREHARWGSNGRPVFDTYYHDQFESTGAFASLGMAAQIWRFTLGVRTTYHYRFGTRTLKSYENTFEVSDRLKGDARDAFHRQRRAYLELGLVL